MALDAAALMYAGRNWPVAPLHSVRNGVCSCPEGAKCDRSPGKHPRTEHGLADASTDPKTIKGWWSQWRDANIAVRCDRLFVLDVDPRHGGPKYLAELEDQHGALPRTFRVATGGGGWHYYFTAPARSWRKQIAPGPDVPAGKGKYVLAPPSNHLSGQRYMVDCAAEIAQAPAWLVEIATAPVAPPAPVGKTVNADEITERRVRAYLAKCPPAVSGSGGHTHTLLVCQHVVRGFALDDATAYALLSEWNRRCEPPWPERDLRRKIQEARSKGERVAWAAHLEDRPPRPTRQREPGEDDEEFPHVEPPNIPILAEDRAEALWGTPLPSPLATGIADLDHAIVGLRAESFAILNGPTGRGKSGLAIQIARHVATTREVVYFTSELSERQVLARVVAQIWGWSWTRVFELGPSEAPLVKEALRGLRLRVEELQRDTLIHERLDAVAQATGTAPVLVLDYLQHAARRLNPEDRRLAVAALSDIIAAWTRRTKSTALVVGSVARNQYDAAAEKSSEQLVGTGKESGDIDYDASLVLFLEAEICPPGSTAPARLHIAKHRFGPSGQAVGLSFDGSIGRFTPDPMAALTSDERKAIEAIDAGAENNGQVGKAIGVRKDDVGRIVRGLVQKGLVDRCPLRVIRKHAL